MEPIELQSSKQGCKNGAKRMRKPLQQIVFGTQQAQEAIDDGDEQGVIDNDALSLSGSASIARKNPPKPMAMSKATSVKFARWLWWMLGSFLEPKNECLTNRML